MKLATIFAVVFAIAFGLCSVGLAVGDRLGFVAGFLFPLSFITEIICFVGLLSVGFALLMKAGKE